MVIALYIIVERAIIDAILYYCGAHNRIDTHETFSARDQGFGQAVLWYQIRRRLQEREKTFLQNRRTVRLPHLLALDATDSGEIRCTASKFCTGRRVFIIYLASESTHIIISIIRLISCLRLCSTPSILYPSCVVFPSVFPALSREWKLSAVLLGPPLSPQCRS